MLVHEAHKPGTDPLINSHSHSWTRFVCREGVNTFSPFDYESFRWLQLHIRNFEKNEIRYSDRTLANALQYSSGRLECHSRQRLAVESQCGCPDSSALPGNRRARPLNPGGSRYRIWPKPGDLDLVECEVQTLSGGIGFKAEGQKGKRTLTLTVPVGIEAELWLDSRENVKLEKAGGDARGISKYIVKGGSRISLKLRYT